jgi:cysteine desulfurase
MQKLPLPIYFDNHATTRVDPSVVEAMLPYFTEIYGNAASTNHLFGSEANDAVEQSRSSIANALGATSKEIVFTSGATESNNLALFGFAERKKRRGNHIVSVCTEHKAVLDPLQQLSRRGFEVTLLPVLPNGHPEAGRILLDQFAASLREETCLVSVMFANNEIGVLQPIAEIGALCREREIPLHCDATQAVGKVPLRVAELPIDTLSFSAHKIYGPKGIGALYVRRRSPPWRLEPRTFGGGHEQGVRSGTLNVPGIVGLAKALELCGQELATESLRLKSLRTQLWNQLRAAIPDLTLNGPTFTDHDSPHRLPGNLNCSFGNVDGEALLISMKQIAVSSGAACTSVHPEPSHVLLALGLSVDAARASLRFGLGRFNTSTEVETAVEIIATTVAHLRTMGHANTGD